MPNLFKQATNNTQSFLLIAYPLAIILVGLAMILMWEDYLTSKAGYMSLPTKKVSENYVILAVAALPQVAQIVLFFVFGRDTRRSWAALLALCFFLADLGTDAWFKSGGQRALIPLAIVESLFIFTLGSEVLFTIAVGFLVEAFGEFVEALGKFIKSVLNAFGFFVSILSNDTQRGERQ